ncbi:helix-turn-helix transcriptional regulator [Paenibacillus silvisoli]|uniref:helix-turn-helix transcriptional regulator n=1 Tax=Paenibacillus silvisoli TaxID=3110539 RepID=UPI002B1BE4BE|nr:helix-turn-helix transcriptional regulator [Paenibacillus silvisoli]
MLKNRLKVILAERNMAHGDFAKAVNVSRNTVSMWVTGKSTPTLEDAFGIAEFFGVSITDIWYKETQKSPPQ